METFSWVPQYSWQYVPEFRVTVSIFESGKEQRAYRGRSPKEWGLEFHDTVAVITQIEAFFEARKGAFDPFLWTPPGGTSPVAVRFKDSSLTVEKEGLTRGRIKVTFREVL